jgi:serine/threonine protein kinase
MKRKRSQGSGPESVAEEAKNENEASNASSSRPPPPLRSARILRPSHSQSQPGGRLDRTASHLDTAHKKALNATLVPSHRRKEIRANQAGTKGWRAPEVLMQSVRQTTAIDMWSAGVMMLSLLSRKYPCFEGTDNETNLLEICRYACMPHAAASTLHPTSFAHDTKHISAPTELSARFQARDITWDVKASVPRTLRRKLVHRV